MALSVGLLVAASPWLVEASSESGAQRSQFLRQPSSVDQTQAFDVRVLTTQEEAHLRSLTTRALGDVTREGSLASFWTATLPEITSRDFRDISDVYAYEPGDGTSIRVCPDPAPGGWRCRLLHDRSSRSPMTRPSFQVTRRDISRRDADSGPGPRVGPSCAEAGGTPDGRQGGRTPRGLLRGPLPPTLRRHRPARGWGHVREPRVLLRHRRRSTRSELEPRLVRHGRSWQELRERSQAQGIGYATGDPEYCRRLRGLG